MQQGFSSRFLSKYKKYPTDMGLVGVRVAENIKCKTDFFEIIKRLFNLFNFGIESIWKLCYSIT